MAEQSYDSDWISVLNLTYVVVKDSLHGEKESLSFVQSQLVVSVTEIVVFLTMDTYFNTSIPQCVSNIIG